MNLEAKKRLLSINIVCNKLENVITNFAFIYIHFCNKTQDGALSEPEQTRNDRHKMRAYNEVLDKQPTSKASKIGSSKFSHKKDHYEN